MLISIHINIYLQNYKTLEYIHIHISISESFCIIELIFLTKFFTNYDLIDYFIGYKNA